MLEIFKTLRYKMQKLLIVFLFTIFLVSCSKEKEKNSEDKEIINDHHYSGKDSSSEDTSDYNYHWVSAKSGLNLRKIPFNMSKTNYVITIPFNGKVRIISSSQQEQMTLTYKTNWSKIIYKKFSGWVMNKYLSPEKISFVSIYGTYKIDQKPLGGHTTRWITINRNKTYLQTYGEGLGDGFNHTSVGSYYFMGKRKIVFNRPYESFKEYFEGNKVTKKEILTTRKIWEKILYIKYDRISKKPFLINKKNYKKIDTVTPGVHVNGYCYKKWDAGHYK